MISPRLVFIAFSFSSCSIHALRLHTEISTQASASPYANGGKEPATVLEQWMRDSKCLDIDTGSRMINLKDQKQILGFLESPSLFATLSPPLKDHKDPNSTDSSDSSPDFVKLLFGQGPDKENHFEPYITPIPPTPKACCMTVSVVCVGACYAHEHNPQEFFIKEHHEDDYYHCMNFGAEHCHDVDTCSQIFCSVNTTMNAIFNKRPRDPDSAAFSTSTTHNITLKPCTEVSMAPSFVETQSQPRCSNLLQLAQLGAKASMSESDTGASVIVSLQVPEISETSWSEAPLGVLDKYGELLKQPLQLVQTTGDVKHYKVIGGNA